MELTQIHFVVVVVVVVVVEILTILETTVTGN